MGEEGKEDERTKMKGATVLVHYHSLLKWQAQAVNSQYQSKATVYVHSRNIAYR